VVVDEAGSICAHRRARSTVASLAALEAGALATAALGTQLVVVIEPTGPAWLPVAVFFGRRGHTVLRVTSAKAADLRRFLARHAKSNSIDAETSARLPLVAPSGLLPVEFGSPARASLDRRVRAVARLTAEIGRRKTRIRTLAQQLVPTIGGALSDDGLNHTDLAVLERYADPRALLAAGPGRLTRLIVTTSRGQLGQAKTQALRTAAAEAVALGTVTAPSPSRTSPPRSPARSAWSGPPRTSEPATSTLGTPPWSMSTRPGWPPACPDWARSAPPS
jgi:transposase